MGTAAAGDVLCEAWTVDGQCWYRVTDYENNVVIQPPTVAGTIVERCQVIWLEAGDQFLLYGMDTGTELYSCHMTPSSSSFTFSTPALVDNGITTYSVKASDDDTAEAAYLVFIDSADAFMYVAVMDKTGLVTAGPTSMAVSPTGNVDIWPDEANSTLYFMGTVLGASPSVILGSCTTALGSISTATGKLAGSVSNADSSTCAIALTENGEIIAAASYVDASVTEDPFYSSTFGNTFDHNECETYWATFNKATFAATSEERKIPWYLVSSQFGKVGGYEPLLLLSYYYMFEDYLIPGILPGNVESTEQRHQLLITMDLTTESVDSETGVDTGTVGAFPVVVAKVNTDIGHADSLIDTPVPHLPFYSTEPLTPQDTVTTTAKVLIPTQVVIDIKPRDPEFLQQSSYGFDWGWTDGSDLILTGTRLYGVEIIPPPVSVISGDQTALINSGYLQSYDGVTLSEASLFARPELVNSWGTGSSGVAKPTSTGTDRAFVYWFRVLLGFRDANGIEHRGEPSDPIPFIMGTGDNNETINIKVTAPGISHIRLDRGIQPYAQLYAAASQEVGNAGTVTGSDADNRFPFAEVFNGLEFSSRGGPFYLVREIDDSYGLGHDHPVLHG